MRFGRFGTAGSVERVRAPRGWTSTGASPPCLPFRIGSSAVLTPARLPPYSVTSSSSSLSQTFDSLVVALCQRELLSSDSGTSLVPHVDASELQPAMVRPSAPLAHFVLLRYRDKTTC